MVSSHAIRSPVVHSLFRYLTERMKAGTSGLHLNSIMTSKSADKQKHHLQETLRGRVSRNENVKSHRVQTKTCSPYLLFNRFMTDDSPWGNILAV